ncbi:hypothetical protein [Streptomyces rimosus]|uniref:hypothetical protein n=1 Tax=Streptomyces rimosus TaxID=1927 RepID=UPI00131EAC4A|nr:hypothetical protein [Streptomyces rimosus]
MGTVGVGPAEAKGKDVIVQNSRGMAKFDHRGDKVVAWDKKPDGRWIEAEIMWNLGGKPGTEGFSVYAKGAGALKTKRARIPEGRKAAIRMCVWKPGRTDCSAWHYGRA